mmetsp:Transcript_11813/g.31884  ORF Transcript_11813/g.31884 Transcript_11813/m.31884 type:complete len:220 (-) Transcript_11813:191-850(-)
MFTGGGAASTLERRGDLDISTTGLIEGTKVALTLIGHLESTAANAERDATESVLRVNGIDGKCDADVICDSFDYVTSSYVTFMSFKRFLLHEQSLENLHFWLDVEVYRGLDEKERWTRARELNERFVRPGAMYEVNVSSQHKQKVAKVLKQQGEEGDVPVDLFDKAQTEVLNVMRRDSYSRFKKSELYIANQTLVWSGDLVFFILTHSQPHLCWYMRTR